MAYQELIKTLAPELVQNFRRAIEIGKWPDGSVLSAEQREHAMQAVIAYEQQFVEEADRVGYIDKGDKAGQSCDDDSPDTLQWKN